MTSQNAAHSEGIAGRIAARFINNKLTPILVLVSVLLGFAALQVTPREEEPQIVVPMIDIMVPWPGHSAAELERLVTHPIEDILMDIPALDFLYSTSDLDGAMLIARFDVGYDTEDALVLVHQALFEAQSRLPMDVQAPQVLARSIDDVPVFAVTLWSDSEFDQPGLVLTDLAQEIAVDLRREESVSDVEVIGAQSREWLVELTPETMVRYQLSPASVAQQLKQAINAIPLGNVLQANTSPHQRGSLRLRAAVTHQSELENLNLVNGQGDSLVLADIARIRIKEQPLSQAVWHRDRSSDELREAVTVAVSKRKGTNASALTTRLIERIAHLREHGIVPPEIQLETVRDYGHSAKEKSDELIKHLLIATLSVVGLIAFALGWRESLVVAIAVPVTLSLTLLLSYLLGFTINRVTLFALIFSIGILVDDAIVVAENIHRHAVMADQRSWRQKILDAVAEVGNPTILATFTVVAAILPMAYVGGLMGPYMLPIPVLASLAMIFSLVIAFAISPWAAVLLMKPEHTSEGPKREDRLTRLYRRFMQTLLGKRSAYWAFMAVTLILLLASFGLVGMKWVQVKMLPFDNKSELQIVIDLPEGTPLAETARVAFAVDQAVYAIPDVLHSQIYVGTASPYTFNGLVRHYFLRHGEHEADIALTLTDRHHRKQSSHEIAKQVRNLIQALPDLGLGNVKVVEIPPGPPVLSTLVAEIYGPDLDDQRELASAMEELMRASDGVVDVDSYEAADQTNTELLPNQAALTRHQITPAQLAMELSALAAPQLGWVSNQPGRTGVPLRLGFEYPQREDLSVWLNVPIVSPHGMVPLGALVTATKVQRDKPIYHKNAQRVVYVTGDVAGAIEAPVYALGDLQKEIRVAAAEMGVDELPVYHTSMPTQSETMSLKWDGEWHITVEVFRDMGIAFAAVIVLIYLLVVGWFKSLTVPLVILSPIPLSLVGILPGHLIFGAFFTATSMIGFIAGAGIIVRNSIILVDFIEMRRRQGALLEDAVIDAGVIRFRPMLLTAAAVVIGSSVILFDPIFQGLAISLMMGEVAATLLSRIAVPLLYAGLNRTFHLTPQ